MTKLNLHYDNDFSNVFSIYENKSKCFINALCFTQSIKHASLELGVSEKCIFDFMGKEDITREHVKLMREGFYKSSIKIKLRFNPTVIKGEKVIYCKNKENGTD